MMRTAVRCALISALLVAIGAGMTPASAQCGASTNCPALLTDPLPPCSPNAAILCTLGMLTFLNQTTMTWLPAQAMCPVTEYDVVFGDLGCLHGTCSFEFSGPSCLVANTTLKSASHTLLPALGQGYYYVVRADNETWNGSGPGECRDHDAILLAVPSCP
jgi:hypothetical protein